LQSSGRARFRRLNHRVRDSDCPAPAVWRAIPIVAIGRQGNKPDRDVTAEADIDRPVVAETLNCAGRHDILGPLPVATLPTFGSFAMIRRSFFVFAALFLASAPLLAGEQQPVRMGCGIMTFDTVPGWGLRPDGQSALGPTHGSVVIDRGGNVYVSADKGVVVFSPGGEVIQSYEGDQYSRIHDMEIRAEGDAEFIYGARNANAEGIKFNAHTGQIVLKLPFPEESGLKPAAFNPTAITVAPNGDIFLADGYASNIIFKFNREGKYLMHFGQAGNDLKQFNTCHGMTLDTRYDPPLLLICDRNHQPKGRLLHYDLDGNFVAEVVTGLGMPTSAAVQGDYVSVPDLDGRVFILDKSNTIMAVLGYNPDPAKGRNYNIPQNEWVEGIFSGTHGSYWDAEGNLYVQDWNVSGRIMKLVRVK
jgi:hypothetical protein